MDVVVSCSGGVGVDYVNGVHIQRLGVQCGLVAKVVDEVRWMNRVKVRTQPKSGSGDILVACSIAEVAGFVHV